MYSDIFKVLKVKNETKHKILKFCIQWNYLAKLKRDSPLKTNIGAINYYRLDRLVLQVVLKEVLQWEGKLYKSEILIKKERKSVRE